MRAQENALLRMQRIQARKRGDGMQVIVRRKGPLSAAAIRIHDTNDASQR